MNVFDAEVTREDHMLYFSLTDSDVRFAYPCDEFSNELIDTVVSAQRVVLGVRPYAVKRQSQGIPATVVVNQWLGDQTHIAADCADHSVVLVEHDRAFDKPGDELFLYFEPSSLHLFEPTTGAAISHGTVLA